MKPILNKGTGRKYHQGYVKLKNPKKYAGNPDNVIFRSLWEFNAIKFLDEQPSVLTWASEELSIPYIDPTRKRADGSPFIGRYYPDFLIKFKTRKGEEKIAMIEVKPKKQTIPPVIKNKKSKRYITEAATYVKNEAKFNAARQFCAKKGWEFVIWTEVELGITRK